MSLWDHLCKEFLSTEWGVYISPLLLQPAMLLLGCRGPPGTPWEGSQNFAAGGGNLSNVSLVLLMEIYHRVWKEHSLRDYRFRNYAGNETEWI